MRDRPVDEDLLKGLAVVGSSLMRASTSGTLGRPLHGGLLSKLAGEDERDAGVVRLTCAEGIIPFLVTELQELRVAHPELRVELLPSTAVLDLQRREADIEVRMFRPASFSAACAPSVSGWVRALRISSIVAGDGR